MTGVRQLHAGVDLVNNSGGKVPIYASASGTVRLVKTGNTGYGKYVIITHSIRGVKYETVYAHLDSYSVKVGQKVTQGEKIGIMGNTGIGTGVHLHFEIHKGTYNYGNGKYPSSLDPMKFINLNNTPNKINSQPTISTPQGGIDLTKVTISDMSEKTLQNQTIAMLEAAKKKKIINNEKWVKQAKDGSLTIADLIGLKILIDNAK